MPRLTERQIIIAMRTAYADRLHEVIKETDAIDSRGNFVIRPDLKVRHKKTQYEYTVDHVVGSETGDDDQIKIALRLPDEPRFEPPASPPEVIEDKPVPTNVLGEQDPMATPGADQSLKQKHTGDYTVDLIQADQDQPGDEVFYIDKAEFEKEYEVK